MSYSPATDTAYLEYDNNYFSAVDIKVFFGSIVIDDCVFLEYTVHNSKNPKYGYSSSMFDAIARGKILVSGTLTINFTRTPLLQTIIDYVKGNNRLTELDELNNVSIDQKMMSNIVSFYRYTAHGDLAYPQGWLPTENAENAQMLIDGINALNEQLQEILIQDPLAAYPDHPNYSDVLAIQQSIQSSEVELYENYSINAYNTTKSYIENPTSDSNKQLVSGTVDQSQSGPYKGPSFSNTTLNPFKGFYNVPKTDVNGNKMKDANGNVIYTKAPFSLQQNIDMALQDYAPNSNATLLTQMRSNTLDDFINKIENRLKNVDSSNYRVRRVDEHDLAEEYEDENIIERYIEDNTFDIILTFGDVNTPRAASTIKVINDVHFIGEAQTLDINNVPILQKFSFIARNVDERPIDDIVIDSTKTMTYDAQILDETNAIQVGDTKYKHIEWLRGHVEDRPYSINHTQTYLPSITSVDKVSEKEINTNQIDLDEQTKQDNKLDDTVSIDVMPLIGTCTLSNDNPQTITAGAMISLTDNNYAEYIARGGVEDKNKKVLDNATIDIPINIYVSRAPE